LISLGPKLGIGLGQVNLSYSLTYTVSEACATSSAYVGLDQGLPWNFKVCGKIPKTVVSLSYPSALKSPMAGTVSGWFDPFSCTQIAVLTTELGGRDQGFCTRFQLSPQCTFQRRQPARAGLPAGGSANPKGFQLQRHPRRSRQKP
jgi:hypothetical protein